MTTTTNNVAEVYRQAQRDIGALLDWIGGELHCHADLQEGEPNWASAGDLLHVRERLIETLDFFGNMPKPAIEDALADLEAGAAATAGCEFCSQEFNRPDGEFECPYCHAKWKDGAVLKR